MIVMQYADNGSLLSYLNQNINKLTWMDKLHYLSCIGRHLYAIHKTGLVHCDLHGRSIVLHDNTRNIRPYICNLGLSRSVKSCKSDSTIRGGLPYIAPEVFYTREFTRKLDVYSFGIIMYLLAAGEQPFRDRQFDASLICEIMNGLRPPMPDSAPKDYKKLAEQCCDADPDKRPNNGKELWWEIYELTKKVISDDNM